MLKPKLLRDHLVRALPELARDPERLVVAVFGGNGIGTATKAVSWMYEYKCRLIFLDWTQHMDAIMAPLLVWIAQHQNELLANPERRGIRFDVDFLNSKTMDIVIELDLTERALVRDSQTVPGGMEITHITDHPPLGIAQRERWEIYIQGEKVAEWGYEPTDKTAPNGGSSG